MMSTGNRQEKAITKILTVYNVTLVTVDNIPGDMRLISDIFNAIAAEGINIDMISQSPPYKGSISLSFTMPSGDMVKAIASLNRFKKNVPSLQVEVDVDNTKITVYGERMKDLPGIAAKLFTAMAAEGIEIKLVTTSEVDISYLVPEKDVDKASEAIKKEFSL